LILLNQFPIATLIGVAKTRPPGPHFRQQEHPLPNGGSCLGKTPYPRTDRSCAAAA
jgi:hypothetical protein